MREREDRLVWWVIAAAAVFYLVRLGQPGWGGATPTYLFDERYTAFTAHRLSLGDPVAFLVAARHFAYATLALNDLSPLARIEWSHPPAAPLVMVPFIWLGGFHAVTVRLCAVVAALVTLVALRSFDRRVAPLACFLLGFDGMFFVFARTAMPHMLLTSAIIGGAAFLWRAITRASTLDAMLAGAGFGFAIAVRWTGAPIALALVLAALVSHEGHASAFSRRVGVLVAAALATYVASFLPYLAHGHGLADLIALHGKMLWFHTHMPASFGQSTPAAWWPFAWQPVSFASGGDGANRWMVVALGNHLLWWSMAPALVWLLARARRRAAIDLFALGAIAAVWLPWVMLGRFGMAYYLLPAAPFLALTVARMLALLPRAARRGFVVASLALFVLSYPVLAAVPLAPSLAKRYQAVLFPSAGSR